MPRNNLKIKILNLKKTKGFTIIELLVVFTIIALTAGIGFVSLASYSRSQALTQAAANIKQSIDTARFNALSNVKTSSCIQLVSYSVRFCANSNPACAGALNTKGYEIVENCASQSFVISTKELPSNFFFTSSSTCENVTFNATTAVASTKSTSGSCLLFIKGYESSPMQITINSQGYAVY